MENLLSARTVHLGLSKLSLLSAAMKTFPYLAALFLFSATSCAAVTKPSLRDRLFEAPSSSPPRSLPIHHWSGTTNGTVKPTTAATAAAAAMTISGNWAGASQGPPPSDTTYASVIGTWTIPTISKSSKNNVTYRLYS